ncbi:hypothetical protein HA052_19640 [Chromobacterium haemolyticum]|uniref:TrfB transcriptional repressor protein domain-containing protein n=1 Tax=Chromobacterium fluminis TaxID=3044269 RepID=A0ABX0LD13_9NEIS|nr:hypothetical protein [Chromobacterium haemolyticum]NHR07407.1 hypothetical protein [Chromobacterium haemolyticum]
MPRPYPITEASLDLMLTQTRVSSPGIRAALQDHFVRGLPQNEAAARHGVAPQQLNPVVRKIRSKIKPAFDAYADLVGAGGASQP